MHVPGIPLMCLNSVKQFMKTMSHKVTFSSAWWAYCVLKHFTSSSLSKLVSGTRRMRLYFCNWLSSGLLRLRSASTTSLAYQKSTGFLLTPSTIIFQKCNSSSDNASLAQLFLTITCFPNFFVHLYTFLHESWQTALAMKRTELIPIWWKGTA